MLDTIFSIIYLLTVMIAYSMIRKYVFFEPEIVDAFLQPRIIL